MSMNIHSHGNRIVEIVPGGVPPPPRNHALMITRDRARIVGCACGWRTPTNSTDSDDTLAEHVAITRAGGRP